MCICLYFICYNYYADDNNNNKKSLKCSSESRLVLSLFLVHFYEMNY